MIRNNFKELLEKHNKTAYSVARDLLLPASTLYKLRNNVFSIPRSHILGLLCSYFDIEVEDLLEIVAE